MAALPRVATPDIFIDYAIEKITSPTPFSVGQSLNIKIFEECYGSLWDNYLTATCDIGQVISIISLKAFAKRRDTRCPQEETAQTPLPSDSCCIHNNSDCGDIYLGDGLAHYKSCNGRQDCTGIPIAWMDTPCHTGEYLNKTNYMRMEYECIPSKGTADPTNNILLTDDAVYIWNPKYPDGNTIPPGGTVTCSVEASCQTRIVVTAIFLKFIQLQVPSGVCGQQVTIEDGTKKNEISCESNNNYTITDIYTSSSHFIKFTVNSNRASNRDWRFWFKFKGVEPHSQITLACGSHSWNSAQSPSPAICTPMSTIATLPTTPPLSTTPPAPSTTPSTSITLVAIVAPLAVILIATLVTTLCCKKNISDKCCCGQGSVYPLSSVYEVGGAIAEESGLKIELEYAESDVEEKAKRKERKRRRKGKKRKKREEKQMNKMRYDGYVPNRSVTRPFRVAGYAASAFRPPVMRPYYPWSGQKNYHIPGHNMYDPQLPLAGSIYGYPAGQHQNFQNIPVYGTASVRSTSTSVSADGNSRDAYVPPASLRRHPSAMPQGACEAPLIFHTGQFEGQFVPQGSIYEPYENPALRRWKAAGMAATFASHPQTRRPTIEIGSVDNPNERNVNQVHDDSIV